MYKQKERHKSAISLLQQQFLNFVLYTLNP